MRYLYSAMLTLCLILPASAAPGPIKKDNPLEAARRMSPSLDEGAITNLLRVYAVTRDDLIDELVKAIGKPEEFQKILESLRQHEEKMQKLEQDWEAYKKLAGIISKRKN